MINSSILLLLCMCGQMHSTPQLSFAYQAPQQIYGYHLTFTQNISNGKLTPCPNGIVCTNCLYFFRSSYLPSFVEQQVPIGVLVGPYNVKPNNIYYWLKWDTLNFKWYRP